MKQTLFIFCAFFLIAKFFSYSESSATEDNFGTADVGNDIKSVILFVDLFSPKNPVFFNANVRRQHFLFRLNNALNGRDADYRIVCISEQNKPGPILREGETISHLFVEGHGNSYSYLGNTHVCVGKYCSSTPNHLLGITFSQFLSQQIKPLDEIEGRFQKDAKIIFNSCSVFSGENDKMASQKDLDDEIMDNVMSMLHLNIKRKKNNDIEDIKKAGEVEVNDEIIALKAKALLKMFGVNESCQIYGNRTIGLEFASDWPFWNFPNGPIKNKVMSIQLGNLAEVSLLATAVYKKKWSIVIPVSLHMAYNNLFKYAAANSKYSNYGYIVTLDKDQKLESKTPIGYNQAWRRFAGTIGDEVNGSNIKWVILGKFSNPFLD